MCVCVCHCLAPLVYPGSDGGAGRRQGSGLPPPSWGGGRRPLSLGIPVKCSTCHWAHPPTPADAWGAGTTPGWCPVRGCWVQWLRVLGVVEEDGCSQPWCPNLNLQGTALLPGAGLAGRAAGESRRLRCNGWRIRERSEVPFPKFQMRLWVRGYAHWFCAAWPC